MTLPIAMQAPTVFRPGSSRIAPPTGSKLDDWWARVTASRALHLRAELWIIGAITLVAALVRLIRLGYPQKLVFDEVYYVTEGWSLTHLGYESKLPDGGKELFAQGEVNAYLTEPKYVVHPPLGKLLIGWGMELDPTHAWSWRIAVCVAGILAVPLLYFVAKRLFGRVSVAALAAGFLAIDGHAIVTSRVSILDGLLMWFVLAGVALMIVDRERYERALQHRISVRVAQTGKEPALGPAIWNRPWLIAAGIVFGGAAAVKWSGATFFAVFCVLTVVSDLLARRRNNVEWYGAGAVLVQAPVTFLLTVPAAVATYLVTWTGWLRSDSGFYRHWVEEGSDRAWTGLFGWVPIPLQNLWHYHVEMYRFHAGLQADHPYNSAPWQWPFMLRPTAFSYDYSDPATNANCHASRCVEAITSVSNPLIFWLGTIGIIFLILMMFVAPRTNYLVVLTGYFAGYLPWLLTGRTSVYQFYVIAWLPFALIAAALVLDTIAGSASDDFRVRQRNLKFVGIFLVFVVAVSMLFYPVWTAMLVDDSYWQLTHWLPGWA